MFTALLDTCVLWPSLQRDFLLSLGIEELYRPVWSAVILDELGYYEEQKLRSRGASQAEAAERSSRLIARMREAFTDAEVTGGEGLEGTFGLPDRDDEHVVAAAVVSGADAIVTHNVRDFPPGKLPADLAVQVPSSFAEHTITVDPARALAAVEEIAARSGRRGPYLTVDEVLALLANRYAMTAPVDILRQVR